MPVTRLANEGQVTTPSEVQESNGIDQGADLIFEVSSEQSAPLRAGLKKGLSELYASLPATRLFPGTKEIRAAVGRALGEALKKRTS